MVLRGNPLCDTPPTAPAAFGNPAGEAPSTRRIARVSTMKSRNVRPAYTDTHRKSLAEALEVSHVERRPSRCPEAWRARGSQAQVDRAATQRRSRARRQGESARS